MADVQNQQYLASAVTLDYVFSTRAFSAMPTGEQMPLVRPRAPRGSHPPAAYVKPADYILHMRMENGAKLRAVGSRSMPRNVMDTHGDVLIAMAIGLYAIPVPAPF